jgi:ubiquinone/menaquinone biosynthesis C-methylase UbiE
VSRLGLSPDASVLDLGAGTGRLTRPLVKRFARVVAVEPDPDMRARLATAATGAEVAGGSAEAIPLGDGSVDAVFVGTAFHWFDAGPALQEIARVLVPNGGLGLIASRWVRSSSIWGREIDQLLRRHGSDPSAGWRDRYARNQLFEPLQEAVLDTEQEHDRDSAIARVASISFIAALPERDRLTLLEEVRDILDRHTATSEGGVIRLPHRIEICWTNKR